MSYQTKQGGTHARTDAYISIDSILRLLLVAVVLSTVTSACQLVKSESYSRGESLMARGSYDEAVRAFQQALRESAGDKETEARLQGARKAAAESHFKLGSQAAQGGDPRKAVAEFELAAGYSDMPRYRQRLQLARDDLARIERLVNQAIDGLRQPADWRAALQQATDLEKFSASFPQLPPRIKAAREQAGKALAARAERALNERRYADALQAMKEAADLSGFLGYQAQARALEAVNLAGRQAGENRYLDAVNTLDQAVRDMPGNATIAAFRAELLQEGSGRLYNEGTAASADGRYLDAIRAFEQLQGINAGFADADQQLADNRLRFSAAHRLQAQTLSEAHGRDAAGRVLAHYLVAKQFDPGSWELDDLIQQARRDLSEEVELRVSVEFDNQSQEPGAGVYVRDRVLDGLRTSDIGNLTVLEREAIDEILQEQGLGQGFLDESTSLQVKRIRGVQSGIKGSVVRVRVRETGRQNPSYGSVRYQSGTRFVPNARYNQLQSEVGRAQQEVMRAQQDLNQAQSNQSAQQPSYGTPRNEQERWKMLADTISYSGAQMQIRDAERRLDQAYAQLQNAQSSLSSEPSQREEAVYADQRYPIYNIKLDAEAVISFRMIDFTTSEVGKTHSVRVTDSVSDRYIPGDPGKGIKDDPENLPPAHVFKEKVLTEAVRQTVERLRGELANQSRSIHRKARLARDRGLEDEATEYYIRYLQSQKEAGGEEADEARTYVNARLGVPVEI